MNRLIMVLSMAVFAGCGEVDCDEAETSNCAHPDNSDASDIVFEDGLPVFVRDGMDSPEDMTFLWVMKLDGDAEKKLEKDTCKLARGATYGGVDVWVVSGFEETGIPDEVTYGVVPEGASEDHAAEALEDGAWYEAQWGSCSCWTHYWKQGEPDSLVRASDC